MTIQVINLGSAPNAGDGDSIRVAFEKINSNFSVIGSPIKTFVDVFTPTAGTEYPSTDPTQGQTWLINDVDTVNGYTFVTGDLVGITAYNGNELFYSGSTWVVLTVGSDASSYLLRDGSVTMDGAYIPSLTTDLITKQQTDDLQLEIDNNTSSISLLNTSLINKADSIHAHLMSDITNATWISTVEEDSRPILGGGLDVGLNKLYSSSDLDPNVGLGAYGVGIKNLAGSTLIEIDGFSGDNLDVGITEIGSSFLTASLDLNLFSNGDILLQPNASSGNIRLEGETDTNVIIKSRSNALGTGNVVINDIRMPNTFYANEGQVLVSGALATDELAWEDLVKAGDTASRPVDPRIGTLYFDTDLGLPIWCSDNTPLANVWVNATGAAV